MNLGEATVEGRYTLKIRDKDTGEIKDEFSFSNFVTDQALYQYDSYNTTIISCAIAGELPRTNITSPTLIIDTTVNTNGKYNTGRHADATDLYPSGTPCVISDFTKSKRLVNGIGTDVIDRVERRILNFTASFIFRAGNEGSYKSLFLNCGYYYTGNFFVRPYSPTHLFSYAVIKRNGAPYTLVLGPNDILEVYYQFILYDDITSYPKTITKNINNVNTSITINKLPRTSMWGGINDLWSGDLSVKGTTPSSPNDIINYITTSKRPYSAEAAKITGGVKSTYHYSWLDSDITSGSKIHSLEVDHGLSRYVLTFNPPILKSDYQEWSMSLSYQVIRKVSA